MNDRLTEMLVGERGAIWVAAKVVLIPNRIEGELFVTVIAGAIVTPGAHFIEGNTYENKGELWECVLIIIPKKKYRSKEPYPFPGWSISQIISTNYANPENWGDEYFNKPD